MSDHKNPYAGLPDSAFWRRSVAAPDPADVDPVTPPPFRLGPQDRIATAGSCFAQHIARTLRARGHAYLQTETGPEERNFGVFSARYGNLYTTRQLLQLFQRAYGLFTPRDEAWSLPDGRLVDPFRPQVEPGGFADLAAVQADRARHLEAVRQLFETCDVFIFTLGLTEGWRSVHDGAVFPLAPGVAGAPERTGDCEFHNFSAAETAADLGRFIGYLREVNPGVRVILTVSPVPLVATYEPRHVLVSTIYSKSALRVAAEEVVRALPDVAYYPSYEIITGHHTRYGYFAEDLRSVTNPGVDRAMALFQQHYLTDGAGSGRAAPRPAPRSPAPRPAAPASGAVSHAEAELYAVICDEEAIER